MTITEPIAAGVTVFKRSEKLADLLDSLREHPVERVYISDVGNTSDRQHIYDRDYPFEIVVLDLEFDAGLGAGRDEIVKEFTEPYILLLDSDHTVLNLEPLYEILKTDESLGGVSGLLCKSDGEIQANAHDFYEADNILMRDIRGSKPVGLLDSHPVFRFDFLPHAGLYRRECVKEYSWDPAYKIGKTHLDFYYGHKQHTDWEFGICAEVLFGHNPGGGDSYLIERLDTRKTWEGKKEFLDKWEFDQIVTRRHWSAISESEQSPGRTTQRLTNRLGIGGLALSTQARLVDLHDIGMRTKAKLYPYLFE